MSYKTPTILVFKPFYNIFERTVEHYVESNVSENNENPE